MKMLREARWLKEDSVSHRVGDGGERGGGRPEEHCMDCDGGGEEWEDGDGEERAEVHQTCGHRAKTQLKTR